MNEMPKLIVVLTVICCVCSALLAAVFKLTEGPIAQSLELRTAKAAQLVLPAGCATPEKAERDGVSYFVGKRDGKTVAVAIEGRSNNGYGGEVRLMVGLGTDGKLVSFEVVQASETPGLGSKMKDDTFKKPICGRDFSKPWKVKKDGGDVDAITAATISSRAAMECIADAVAKYERIKGAL